MKTQLFLGWSCVLILSFAFGLNRAPGMLGVVSSIMGIAAAAGLGLSLHLRFSTITIQRRTIESQARTIKDLDAKLRRHNLPFN